MNTEDGFARRGSRNANVTSPADAGNITKAKSFRHRWTSEGEQRRRTHAPHYSGTFDGYLHLTMRFTVFAIAATTALAAETAAEAAAETTTKESTAINADAAWGKVQADCQERMAATRVELSNGLTLAALIEEDRVEDLLNRLSVAQLSLLDARRAVTSAAKAMNHGRLGNRNRIIRKAQLACDAIDVDGLHWVLSGLAGSVETTGAAGEETKLGEAFFAQPEVIIGNVTAKHEDAKSKESNASEEEESKESNESDEEELTDVPTSKIDLTDDDIDEGYSTELEAFYKAEQLSTELEAFEQLSSELEVLELEENQTETDEADFDEDEFFGVFKDSRLPRIHANAEIEARHEIDAIPEIKARPEIQANAGIEARPEIQAIPEIVPNAEGSWVFPNGQI